VNDTEVVLLTYLNCVYNSVRVCSCACTGRLTWWNDCGV